MKTVQLNHLERGRLKNLARTYVLEKGSLVLLSLEECLFVKESQKILRKKSKAAATRNNSFFPKTLEEQEALLDAVAKETDELLEEHAKANKPVACGNRLYHYADYLELSENFPEILKTLQQKEPYAYSRKKALQMLRVPPRFTKGSPTSQSPSDQETKSEFRRQFTQARLIERAKYFNEQVVYWREHFAGKGLKIRQTSPLVAFTDTSYGQFWCTLDDDSHAGKVFNYLKLKGEIHEAS